MFCNYMETRLKTCLYIYSYNNVCTATIFQRPNWIIEIITNIRRPIYTYLYVHILMIKDYRFVLFYMLTDVHAKSKCTCVDVERFKDMFANSERSLAVATAHTDQAFIVGHRSVFYFSVFYFAMLIARKQKYQSAHGLIHLRPSDEHFFIGILFNQK